MFIAYHKHTFVITYHKYTCLLLLIVFVVILQSNIVANQLAEMKHFY